MKAKKILSLAVALIMVVCMLNMPTIASGVSLWDGNVDTTWYNTTDTQFTLDSAEDLAGLATIVNGTTEFTDNFSGKTVTLSADIDLNNRNWAPIGSGTNPFEGMFDGGEHIVSNLYINGDKNYVSGGTNDNYNGLFGYMKGGSSAGIKNITVCNAKVIGCLYVGVILGRSYTGGIIENCHVTGDVFVDGYSYIGGIVGRHDYSSGLNVNGDKCAIYNCSVIDTTDEKGTINGDYAVTYVGGIVGFMGEGDYVIEKVTVKNIAVTGVYGVGGISGIGHYGNTISTAVVESSSVASTDNDPNSARTGNVGLIAGAVQGTDSQPTVIIGYEVKDTTATVNGETTTAIYGSTMTGETPVTNYQAKIGDTLYETLADAVSAATSGDTITLLVDLADVDLTVNKAITIDLNSKTITDAYIILKKAVEIKNGSIKNRNESYPLVVQDGGHLTINDVAIEASKSDRAIWVRSNSALTFNRGSILATKGEGNTKTGLIAAIYTDSNTQVYINGGTITVDAPNNKAVGVYGNYTNADVTITGGKISTSGKNYSYGVNVDGDITMTGGEIVTNEKGYGYSSGIRYGYNYAMVTALGNVTVTGGKITTNGYSGYMISAGRSYSAVDQAITISGVEFTNNLSVVETTTGGHKAPNLIYEGSAATVTATITSGTFSGVSSALVKGDSTTLTVSGGTFTTAPNAEYLAEGFELVENKDGTFGVADKSQVNYAAKVGDTSYETLKEALKAMSAENSELTLLSDITITEDWDCRNNGATFEFPVTINGNGYTLKFTGKINDGYNYLTVFRPKAASTFKDLTVDMSEAVAVFQNRFSVISSADADLTVENCTFIGSKTYANSRAIIFAEGSQNNDANVVVRGCTFTDWKYGVTDNLNGKDVATVEIIDSKFTDASVNVSASDKVIIKGNEVDGGYIKVASYTNSNNNNVTVVENIIDEAFADDNVIYCDGTLNVQEGFVIPAPELPTATVTDISKEELIETNAPTLTFAKKFVADEVEEKVADYYEEWYADFVLTLNKTATFNADGSADGYLAGQYDAWSENWVSVPFENVTLEAGKSLKIMEYAAELMGQSGLKITYNDVLNFVKEFNCGIFFNDEYLKANPDLKVTLELRIYNNQNEEESYSIGDNYEFDAPQIPTGTLTNAYTSESAYWGECGGNAKESFEFKLYNDDTYMGYTSLNNVGGIIDGDVYVSWHIKLDAESNTDEYWDMAWEINPTIDMQPNRVEQWVDGVKVAECVIEPNWSDRIFPVVAAVTDDNGKILSYVNNTAGHTLADAFANGGKVVLLDDINIDYALTVKEDMILDLNGHTITATDKMVSGSFNLISISKGKHLTVNDSVGTGEINLTATTDRDWNAQSTIFENRGSQLTINGGTFEHLGGTDMAFVVNVNSNSFGDAILNVNGGSLDSSYIAIRLFMDSPSCNPGSGTAFVNVAGGEIKGVRRAIWAQAPNSVAGQTGEINITDGKIIGLIETDRSSAAAVETVVSGGTVDDLKVEAGELKITGGTVTGTLTVLDASGNAVESDEIITGGTFTNNLSAFVAEGYELTENEDGTFGVEKSVFDYLFKIQFAIINMEKAENGNFRCAFVAGIDSLKYKEVGFKFYYNGQEFYTASTKKVYSSLSVTSTSGKTTVYTPEQFGAYRLFYLGAELPPSFDNKAIEYQPYAITFDGEEVVGIKTELKDIYTLDK